MATRIGRRFRYERTNAVRLRDRNKPSPRLKSVKAAGRAEPPFLIDEETLGLARRLLALRRRRDNSFGAELFSEPAWDILLDLYVGAGEGRAVSVSSACEGAAAPATTALRKLRQLEESGWLLREGDPEDARRSYVRLSAAAVEKMHGLLKGACSRLDDGNK